MLKSLKVILLLTIRQGYLYNKIIYKPISKFALDSTVGRLRSLLDNQENSMGGKKKIIDITGIKLKMGKFTGLCKTRIARKPVLTPAQPWKSHRTAISSKNGPTAWVNNKSG